MEDFIWIVVNAGGDSREKEVADEFNARACRELTERRVIDQADILAEGPNNQALQLKEGDRIAMHQGGGKNWRALLGAGQLMARGHVREQPRPLEKRDLLEFRELYELTRRYFPKGKRGNNLVGIVLYSLKRAANKLPIEDVYVRPGRGNKFIRVGSNHPGYQILNEWWKMQSV
jgi:hypothetical protein